MQKNNEKKESQPLELNDDESIDVSASYDFDNPLWIDNPDPNMRYYFAANDGDKSRPDGVARVMQMGYRKSEKDHGSTDCMLLEMPLDKWKRMQDRRRRHFSRDKEEEAHAEAEGKIRGRGESPVRLEGGGIKRS